MLRQILVVGGEPSMRLYQTQGENHTVLLVITCICHRTSSVQFKLYITTVLAACMLTCVMQFLFLFLFQSKRLVKTSPERPQSSIESVWSKLQRFVIIKYSFESNPEGNYCGFGFTMFQDFEIMTKHQDNLFVLGNLTRPKYPWRRRFLSTKRLLCCLIIIPCSWMSSSHAFWKHDDFNMEKMCNSANPTWVGFVHMYERCYLVTRDVFYI